MTDKKEFTDFSFDEIKDVAKKAGQQASRESLVAGLEVLSKNLKTGKYYVKKLDCNGEVKEILLSDSEVDALRNKQ